MSQLKIRAALESALKALRPDFPTAWENISFTPTEGVAYQAAYVLFADPSNPTLGDGYFRENGYLQITLNYPGGTGSRAIGEHAAMLQSAFKRGSSFAQDGITVIIERTPAIGNGRADGNWWAVPVKVRFYAEIFN